LQDAERASEVKSALLGLLKRGEVVEWRVNEAPNVPCYALADAPKETALRKRLVRILSPFDNLVIQRQRLRWLFGFDYIIECYVPAAKRRFGYFVLPVLFGEEFIGRLDAKADRPKRKLVIHRLDFEEGFTEFEALQPLLHDALEAFTKFQNCDGFEVVKVTPAKARKLLRL
jgi:uncharacterized protein YcaQ